jgi:DNA repair photolyase
MVPGSFLRMDTPAVTYRRVQCKSLLNKSGIADYAVNCYSGCSHGCVYCYARFAARFTHPGEAWGKFVDVKENAVQVLMKEVKRRPPANVVLSSVCDAWQPVEEKTLLTRQCIEILTRYRFSLHTLTKNALASRDLDLLALGDTEFGVTVTTTDTALAGLIEPGASPPQERLELLQTAKSKGLKTYAFIGPLMPFLTDTGSNIISVLKAVKDVGVDYFYADKLNLRYGVWPDLIKLLKTHYPTLLPGYRRTLFEPEAKESYRQHLQQTVNAAAVKLGVADKLHGIM